MSTVSYRLKSVVLLPSIILALGFSCLQAQNRSCLVTENAIDTPALDVLNDLNQQINRDSAQCCIAFESNLPIFRKKITLQIFNVPVEYAVRAIVKQLGLKYINNGCMTIQVSTSVTRPVADLARLKGHVKNENNESLPDVSISVQVLKNGKIEELRGTKTDKKGDFSVMVKPRSTWLIFSSIGYITDKVYIRNIPFLDITLAKQVTEMDTVRTGYSFLTLRQNTGNIVKVPGSILNQAAVTGFPEALEGRVSGVSVSATSGLPGSLEKILIRGQISIGTNPGIANLPANDPLFIVNGVPLASGNKPLNLFESIAGDPRLPGSSAGGMSVLNFLYGGDIESIEVLKDAAATSIYGSRGANGVILITTKRGRPGKLRLKVNVSGGTGRFIKMGQLLNTGQYIALRREAFANDNRIPDKVNAPDLTVWDTTRYTDFRKFFLGEASSITSAHVSAYGGDNRIVYMVSGAIRRETTVVSKKLFNEQRYFNSSLSITSKDKKLQSNISLLYTWGTSRLIKNEIMPGTYAMPNLPPLYDNTGNLSWKSNGSSFTNPAAGLLNNYEADVNTLVGNIQLSYSLPWHIIFKSNVGINNIRNEEAAFTRIAAQNPDKPGTGSSSFGTNVYKSWIAEPQLTYALKTKNVKLDILAGSTFQGQANNRSTIDATGYPSDALLRSESAAAQIHPWNMPMPYKYNAIFGAVNVDINRKYFVYLTGRRDGSSRFGPGKLFGNFGATGLGWIFVDATSDTVQRFLSFGKIKGSYGTSGNDQIGDFTWPETWTSAPNSNYGGVNGLSPTRLYNPALSWEITKKLDLTLDLELMKQVKLSATWYMNRSSNQLVSSNMPSQVGFTTINNGNFPVIVQNTGWELTFIKNRRNNSRLGWQSTLVATIPRNRLVDFPGIETSPYKNSLVPGQSLTTLRGYHLKGVDTDKGLFIAEDKNGDGNISAADDYFSNGNTDPCVYGSFSNSFKWKKLQMEIYIEGRQQLGINPLSYTYSGLSTGNMNDRFYINQSIAVLNRWQKPGDIASLQKLTSLESSQAASAISIFKNSDRQLIDASYLRLKSVLISYTLPGHLLSRLHVCDARVYLQGYNLATVTSYKDADPVIQNPDKLPPLTKIMFGIQITP